MLKLKLLGTTMLQSAVFVGAALAAQPVLAQEVQGEQPADQPPAGPLLDTQEIVEDQVDCEANPNDPNCAVITVTGSRIRRPNLESSLPVTSVSGAAFFETGNVSIGDTLNDLPALRSTFSQANSTRFLGTAGLNLLDLRGLGTVRTLVLQNGRRLPGGDVLSSGVTPDVNTIPTDLIERVDVVTGGNSAVYGSDAIAGVVNFILREDYEGIQVRGQGGISKYGDNGSYFISGLYGANFADGRGNIAINAEYAKQNDAYASNRPWLARQDAFVQVNADQTGPAGPDRLFFHDVNSASFNNTGLVRFGGTIVNPGQPNNNQPSGVTCGSVANATGASAFYNCPYIFTPTGQLIPMTGTRIGLGNTGSFVGGNGENFRGGRQFQLAPVIDRYNLDLLAHFDVSDAFTPFVEARYSHTKSVGAGSSGPAFFSGTTFGDPLQFFYPSGGPGRSATSPGNREAIALNNPYLDPAARTLITSQILASGVNTCTFRPLTALDQTRIADGTYRFCVRESMLELGRRQEEAKRDTFRIVGGVRGDFNDDWSYEVSLNYGQLKEKTKIQGNLDVQRFLLAMDAVRDPVSGNIVCASQIDPDRAFGGDPWYYYQYYGPDDPRADPNAPAKLAADIAACTPVNALGGNFTQAQRDYLLQDTIAKGTTKQFDMLAFISGDTSQFLNLPGGPIGFVLGAEYRTDNVTYQQDLLVELGYTFYNAIPGFHAPKQKVKEAFGEIRIPILKDTRFFEELEISGAVRASNYNIGNTGTVWAYNGSAMWSPIDGVRFRGNYGRSVRAPNQVELFSPPGQNFAPGFGDPCSAININQGSSNRAANCEAAGRPVGYDFRYSQSLELRSGGNTELEAETSDSYTAGVVLTPKFLPGFSLSADYYNIKVKNVITAPTPQAIVNACYDLPDLSNQFCDLFVRAGPGGGPGGEEEFQIIEGSLFQGPLNYAKLVAKGIDVEVAYRARLGGVGLLDASLTWTHVIDRSNFLDPTNPKFKNVIVGHHGGELGDPKDAFNLNVALTRGRFTVGHQLRYISPMYLNTYEDFNSVQGRPPENPDYADQKKYGSRIYNDIRLGVDVTKDYNFYLGIDNLMNTKPPLGLTGIGAGSGIYDVRGRFFYAGAVAKF